MTWKTIDTAPLDRPILVCAEGKFAVVKWHPPACARHENERRKLVIEFPGSWQLEVAGLYAENGEWTPELWMEIPKIEQEDE